MIEALREYSESIEGSDHYGVLNVEKTASAEEIRTAYLQLAKRFHADLFVREADEVRALSERINRRIREAYRALSEGESESGFSVGEIFEAESTYQRAAALLERGDAGEALKLFESIESLYHDNPEYKVRYYYAQYLLLSSGSGVRDRAKVSELTGKYEALHKSLPQFWEGYYYLSMIYKSEGRLSESLSAFESGDELSQGKDIRSLREIRLHRGRQAEQQSARDTKDGIADRLKSFLSRFVK